MLEILHTQTNTTIQHFGICFFVIFLKEVVCAHQGCIYLIENTRKKLILLNIIKFKIGIFEYIIKCNYLFDGKAGFQHHYSGITLICSRNISYS